MVIVKLLRRAFVADTGKTRLTTCRASIRAAAGHRRAIKSTGVGGLRRIRLVVILHPAYQLMQRKPVKEMKLVNFPATYQTSSWYKAGVVTVINVAEALLIDGS